MCVARVKNKHTSLTEIHGITRALFRPRPRPSSPPVVRVEPNAFARERDVGAQPHFSPRVMLAHERASLLASTNDVRANANATSCASASVVDDDRGARPSLRRTRNTLFASVASAAGVFALAVARERTTSSNDGTAMKMKREYVNERVERASMVNEVTKLGASDLERFASTEGEDAPIFLHIPKSGGTTIESVLGKLGINVGCCNPRRPYELRGNYGGMESWHTPPSDRVANSWAVVRNPYYRAASEFLWQTNWGNTTMFHSLNPGYSVHNCETFQRYVKNHAWALTTSDLARCYREGGYTIESMKACDGSVVTGNLGVTSHWIPQVIMAASAERVFKIENCFAKTEGTCPDPLRGGEPQDNILKFMREHYSPLVSFDDKINEWNERVTKPDLMSCWREFDPEVLNAFNFVYAEDIQWFNYPVIERSEGALGASFDPYKQRQESLPSLGEIAQGLPSGEILQENVAPSCSGGARKAPSTTR